MLDPILSMDMEREDREFNDIILNGLKIKNDIELLDRILVSVIKNKGEELNSRFKYLGYEPLTPIDEIKLLESKGNSKPEVDISISDVRKYRLIFEFDGVKFDHIITLLAQQHDNSVRISGNKLYLAPVWTDPIISPITNGNGMFIKFYGGKYNVENLIHTVIMNNEIKHITVPIIPKFYNITKSRSEINKRYRKLEVPISLYPLLKYSLKDVVEKFGELKFGEEFLISDGPIETIDLNKYDCITTRGEQLKELSPYPERHNVHIYIIKDSNLYNYKLAYGIIYAFDALPKRSSEILRAINTSKEYIRWKVLIGTLAFKDSYNNEGLIDALINHLQKIESFIDEITKQQLEELNIEVNDIYELLVWISKNYDSITRAAKIYSNVFKNKRLELLYYVMFNLIVDVNKTIDELYKAAKLGRLNKNHISFLIRGIKTKGIYNIVKSKNKIIAVYQFASVNDNRITKLSITELQDRASGVVRPSGKEKDAKEFPESVRQLNGYALYMGNALHYPKNCPTPLRTLNPFTRFKPNGALIIPPELEEEIMYIDKLLRNEITDDNEIENITIFDTTEKIE